MGSNCERCNDEITTEYGSGRFCSAGCARAFSTIAKRQSINEKLSEQNRGKRFGQARKEKRDPLSVQHREHIRQGVIAKAATRPLEECGRVETRRRVIAEQNNQCAECGIPAVWNGKPLSLQLDHIDGNRKNTARSNLRALCPNCHAQTPTWGIRNMRISREEHGKRATAWKHERKTGIEPAT